MEGSLASLIAELDEQKTLEEVRRALDGGADPLSIVDDLREGMAAVGVKFESREYFLPDLILSAELFKDAISLIEPHLKGQSTSSKGLVVIGTVQGDVHDIGKNIVATMLRCSGYDVHDLGTDVPPSAFVDEVRETGAGLVAMSGLLTLGFESMKKTVDAFTDAGLRQSVKMIIGGGPTNEAVVEFCGADACGKDPTDALRLADTYVEGDLKVT
jgi:methanogenic corrinoid protein MtbC1